MDNRRDQIVAVLADRQVAYRQTFERDGDRAISAVLKDLKRFCRADESCFHADARIHAVLEGRREVILRIQDFLTLTIDELVDKYGKAPQ